jgi:lipoprotein-anchoring transpeptidase ErfK/SrfK
MPRLLARLPMVVGTIALALGLFAPGSSAAPLPSPRSLQLVGAVAVVDPSPAIAGPSPADGATIAGVVQGVEALSQPGAGRKVWRVQTETSLSGEPQVLLVLGSAMHDGQEWLRVLLPIRPDGTTGWIPRNYVDEMHTPYWVSVNTSARTVTVDRDGRQLQRFSAVVGKPSTPTPDGLAAIYEKDPQADPTAFLGPWALPLTILSNVLYSFGGGPGRVGIHGRDGASLLDPLGTAASHGCIRIDNDPVTWMAHHLPPGTPVMISG